MALLFMDGFDAGDVATKWSVGTGAVSSTNTRFAVGRSVQVPYGSFAPKKIFSTQIAQLFVGFSFAASNTASTAPFFHIWGDAGATLHLTISWDGGTSIQIKKGSWNGTVIASGLCPQQAWQYVEISTTISSTIGTCEVRVNGVTVVTYSGNTKNGGTNNSVDAISGGNVFSPGANYNYYDDLYVADATGSAPYNTFLGDLRINTLTPTATGSSTGFTSSAGANYTAVDELPYSATDYVSATASGTRDLYAMGDISGNYTVLGVQNNVIAKKTDAGGTAIKSAIKSGASIYYGPTVVATPSDTTVSDLRTTDPATSAAWTITGVNNLEAGMEIA